ncbi:MAG: ABC transporter permease subunit [Bacteroidales bacterium]|nr:ABC transporter permease subunit [Bacteroidales bacterium]
MMNLLKMELFKLRKQKKTWISFWVFALIMAIIHLGLYVDGESLLDLLLQSYKSQLLISGNIVNAYLVSYIALNTLWVHIPILLVIVTGEIVSGEFESGSIRNLLSSPLSRGEFIMAKSLAAFIYVIAFMLFMAIITLIPSFIIFGSGDLLVFMNGIQIILAEEALYRFLFSFSFGALSMICFASISIFFSVLFKNSLMAILSSLGILVISTLIQSFAFGLFENWQPFLFTYHMTQWQLFFLRDIPYNEIVTSVLFLLSITILSTLASIFIFKKTQITE